MTHTPKTPEEKAREYANGIGAPWGSILRLQNESAYIAGHRERDPEVADLGARLKSQVSTSHEWIKVADTFRAELSASREECENLRAEVASHARYRELVRKNVAESVYKKENDSLRTQLDEARAQSAVLRAALEGVMPAAIWFFRAPYGPSPDPRSLDIAQEVLDSLPERARAWLDERERLRSAVQWVHDQCGYASPWQLKMAEALAPTRGKERG